MNSINTGGPAFPIDIPSVGHSTGMTLRDYFAAKAMQAVLSDPEITDIAKTKDWIAICSYSVADAMLKAREQ